MQLPITDTEFLLSHSTAGRKTDLMGATPAPSASPPPTTTEPPVNGRVTDAFSLETQDDEMVYFTIQIDMFAEHEREPTETEITAMMCEAEKFFQKTLKEKISPDVSVFASNIYWKWDDRAALPSVVEFYADVKLPDGSRVPAQTVFEAMEKVDVKEFVQDYIWMSEPYQGNAFYQTEDIFFAGRYSGTDTPPEPHEAKIPRVNCGAQ